VFAADQLSPVRRRVAIKILKAGMDSRAVLTRFDAERQALALMDHPAIAKVFDAGETETGRPYFVMELVDGEPITTYCETHHLTLRDRLTLFVSVCRAIEHAHHKGVIHRDLKPSNILVTTVDGMPHAKVIDFGIAKATTAGSSAEAPRTLAGELLGTPEYMSPEQASSRGMDVDTRSDVYSLGVVLYRLLTGRVPFESERLRRTPVPDLQRILLEEAPPRPSTLSGGRELRGDLDWIVLRAMDKDRERRYPSAAAFADDVERHLRHEPVEAGPPTMTYRLGKIIRRHRALVAGVAAVLAALVIGIVATSTQAVRATRAEDRARKEANAAAAVNEFLERMLTAADPRLEARGRDVTVREVLDRASREIGDAPMSAPEVEAGVRHALGSTYMSLGLYEEAEAHLARAVEVRSESEGAAARSTLDSRLKLTSLHELQGERALAESLLNGIARDVESSAPDPELRVAYLELRAGLSVNRSRYEEADSVYSEIIALRRANLADAAATATEVAALAFSLGELAEIKKRAGRLAEADSLGREAYDFARRARSGDHYELAATSARWAGILAEVGKMEEAEERYREAVAIASRVLGPDHRFIAEWMAGLAQVQTRLGRPEEAEANLRRAIDILDPQVENESGPLASLMGILATILQDRGKMDEALEFRLKALALQRSLFGDASSPVATAWNNLGATYRLMHRYDEAADAFLQALPVFRSLHGEAHPNIAVTLNNLGKTRLDQGRFEEGERLAREAIDMGDRVLPASHPGRSIFLATHGRAIAGLGRIGEGRAELRRAHAELAAAYGPDHPRTKEVIEALAALDRQ
jgi:tetratricopeptide (TPR) repeat protein